MKTFAGISPKIEPYFVLVRCRDIYVQQRGYAVVYDDKIFVKPVQHAFCNGKNKNNSRETFKYVKHVQHVS